ncbi:shikimate dehydrogenase [Frigoribacterium sp. PhB24]|uniref:shikimate dehydrogenase family protein n=1 Tax=Frigoribacterium sp. PhB24 TaxID=2485204 RepID=UPI000F473D81|nr:shikimate dehydrogenase [Frigoribacterium sp. PhB24]ROS48859.1 shikimate 5-dehydrogenase [Frigoribacterium sp. PhB24]
MTPVTLTPSTLTPATHPTFYFVGVTTGSSSIRRVFPRWADELGLGDVELVGIDIEPHAPADEYRTVVDFLATDDRSLGALVTTHKIDLFHAARESFDEVDPLAALMGEVSCLSKRQGQLRASAKDPFSSGLAIDAFAPPADWAGARRDVFVMGAGGSAIAMDWHLSRPERGDARPARVIVSDRSAERLATAEAVHAQVAPDVPFTALLVESAADNDAQLASLNTGAFVVNATGLGKDAPGSPLGSSALFPEAALVWELNYRGDLVFLEQARAQQEARRLVVEDGWTYFVHGWTRVISEVFDIDIPTSGPRFERLSEIAVSTR